MMKQTDKSQMLKVPQDYSSGCCNQFMTYKNGDGGRGGVQGEKERGEVALDQN